MKPSSDASAAAHPGPSLRPYQLEGVGFLVGSVSALLADEMGLGKGVQTALALREVLSHAGCDRALVVVPAALRLNWERELARWSPSLTVRRVRGNWDDRDAYYRLPIPVLIASYEQIRSDASRLAPSVHFDVVVLDEAQRIKNGDSATAHACRLLSRSRCWALTGTPIENSVEDLVSIFRLVRPRLIHSRMSRGEIHHQIRPHFLRRRKVDVLPQLPPIIYQDLVLELQGAQRAAYEDVWYERERRVQARGLPASEGDLLALITELKLLCNHDPVSEESVKLETLKLMLENMANASDKIIVFSQYVKTLEWLSARLASFSHDLLHGGMSELARDAALSRFSERQGPRALLVSLRAGGVGLNIQSASAVVLFDRWWNPAVEAQAIQRAHRFGREQPLHVARFLVRDTIEERIDSVLQEKQVLFDDYVEAAENAAVPRWSRRELLRVLGLDAASLEAPATPNGSGNEVRHGTH